MRVAFGGFVLYLAFCLSLAISRFRFVCNHLLWFRLLHSSIIVIGRLRVFSCLRDTSKLDLRNSFRNIRLLSGSIVILQRSSSSFSCMLDCFLYSDTFDPVLIACFFLQVLLAVFDINCFDLCPTFSNYFIWLLRFLLHRNFLWRCRSLARFNLWYCFICLS